MKKLAVSKLIKSNGQDLKDELSNVTPLANSNQNSFLQRIFNGAFPSKQSGKNHSLIYAWLASLVAVSLLLMTLQNESSHFFGIVEGKQQSISFQHPVDIVNINVVEGQDVDKGEKLLQVRRNDLASRLAIIDDKISEIRLANQEFIATTRAKVRALVAEQKAKYNELSTAINRLETRYKLNTNLHRSSKIAKPDSNEAGNLMVSEIKDLKASRWHTNNSYQAQIDNLNEQLSLDERPATAQLAELDKRKSELIRQQSDLTVSALFHGSVGSILYKPGETVEPFKPIISLHSAHPNIVKGYIHESILNTIEIGQTVWVKSLGAKIKNKVYQGKVESLGSRMVDYPLRLRRDKNVLAFGREVVIKLSDQGSFLLSEKVIVTLEKPRSLSIYQELESAVDYVRNIFSIAYSHFKVETSSERIIPARRLRPISSKIETINSKYFEASGITSLGNSEEYLVISDETINTTPVVAIMNRKGELTAGLTVTGGPLIDDVESISRDGEYIYLASSLSYSKKGQLNNKRRLFIQLVQAEEQLRVIAYIDLHQQLLRFSQLKDTHPDTKALLQERISNHDLEIESHYVHNNSLFIGLKSPSLYDGDIILLRIAKLDQFIQGKTTKIEIWKTIRLSPARKNEKVPSTDWQLTDMAFRNGSLYLLTVNRSKYVSKDKQQSALWQISDNPKVPNKRMLFQHRAAEGVFIDHRKNELIVVFDEGGKKSSMFFRTNLLPLRRKLPHQRSILED